MDIDWQPVEIDSLREVSLRLHRTSTPLEVLNGAVADLNLTPFVESGTQSSTEVSITLRWHLELYGVDQPSPGQVLEVLIGEQQLWVGIIQAINDYSVQSGDKRMTVVARSRNTLPRWRDTRLASDIYPLSTPYNWILQNIAEGLGLDLTFEVDIPTLSATTMQSNVQLADLTPWQMLMVILQPLGLEPFVDARGRLKTISRDLTRDSDIVLTDNRRLVNVNGSKSRPSVTEVKIKWLDPVLREVSQQDQILDKATITAGFFKLTQHKDIVFSQDQTQRARDTYMVVRQSANAGLLSFCTEEYQQNSPTTGLITVTTSVWAPGLATIALAEMLAASLIPDTVVAIGVGGTLPVGRVVHDTAEVALLLIMMCLGTGQYEIWGTPYDLVHSRNTTTAYNPAAKDWEINVQEIENDFVTSEAMAQNMAVRELIYAYRAASSYNISLVDDPRIEPGDIVELSDGSRVYVNEYSRDLSSGAPAILKIQGFRADKVNITVGVPIVIDDGIESNAPVNLEPPVVSGGTTEGTTLIASPGSWAGLPTPTISGQWFDDGVAISGAIGTSYPTPSTGSAGHSYSYTESASNTAGGPIVEESNSILIHVVAPATAPVFTANPVIIGVPTEGVASAYVSGSYTGTPPITVTHEYEIDAAPVSGAGYTPVTGDVTKTMTVTQTATNAYGSDSATSSGIDVVAAGVPGGATPLDEVTWAWQDLEGGSSISLVSDPLGISGGRQVSRRTITNSSFPADHQSRAESGFSEPGLVRARDYWGTGRWHHDPANPIVPVGAGPSDEMVIAQTHFQGNGNTQPPWTIYFDGQIGKLVCQITYNLTDPGSYNGTNDRGTFRRFALCDLPAAGVPFYYILHLRIGYLTTHYPRCELWIAVGSGNYIKIVDDSGLNDFYPGSTGILSQSYRKGPYKYDGSHWVTDTMVMFTCSDGLQEGANLIAESVALNALYGGPTAVPVYS